MSFRNRILLLSFLHSCIVCCLVCVMAVTPPSVHAAAPNPVSLSGWIGDSKCGTKMFGYCAKACIGGGEKPILVTEAREVISIANPESTKGFEGERVAVKGTMEEGKLTITAIELAPPKKQ